MKSDKARKKWLKRRDEVGGESGRGRGREVVVGKRERKRSGGVKEGCGRQRPPLAQVAFR